MQWDVKITTYLTVNLQIVKTHSTNFILDFDNFIKSYLLHKSFTYLGKKKNIYYCHNTSEKVIDRAKGRVFRLTALISSQIFFLGFTTEERRTFAKCPSICFLGQNLHQSGQERQGKSKPKLTRIKFSNIVSFLRLLLDPFKKFLGEVKQLIWCIS